MRKGSRFAAVPLVFVGILLLADITTGLHWMRALVETMSPEPVEDAAERTFEGGGPLRAFVDDMADSLARSYAEAGLPDYYGGAVPAPGENAAKWRHDLYRWAVEQASGSPRATWRRDAAVHDGAWQFGSDPFLNPKYPAGVISSAITPVIDLRGIEPLVDEEADVSVDTGTPMLYDPAAVQPQAETLYESLFPGGRHSESAAFATSVAALRVRHAYGFAKIGGTTSDGGRVEVAVHHEILGWLPWVGLQPSEQRLRLDEGAVEGRFVPPTGGRQVDFAGAADVEVPNSTPTASAYAELVVRNNAPLGDVRVNASSDRSGVLDTQPPMGARPWMYGGNVTSSSDDLGRGPWAGFVGDSMSWVDSVFDLSRFAGHEIRLRFIASTAQNPTSGDDGSSYELGWLIDRLEVHAVGDGGIQIVGFASPGDGAILPTSRDFLPQFVIQNLEPVPVTGQLSVRIAGNRDDSTFHLGGEAAGRALISAQKSFRQLAGTPSLGVYPILANATVPLHGEVGGLVVNASQPPGAERRFAVLFGTGGGWEPVALRFRPADAQEGEERTVVRHQTALLQVDLQNLSPTPTTLQFKGPNPSLRPEARDLQGLPVGEMIPGQDNVTLPVSRETSGALGQPFGTRTVNWTWTGSNVAKSLDLVLLDAANNTVYNGGRVLVESLSPPELDLRFANPWRYAGACKRLPEFEERRGVIRCDGAGAADSYPAGVLEPELDRGNQSVAVIVHRGSAATVQLRNLPDEDVSDDPPLPTGPGWVDIGSPVNLSASPGWRASNVALGAARPGWLGLRLSTAGPDFSFDEARLEIRGIPKLWTTFDAEARPERFDVGAASKTRLAWLNGVDEWTNVAHLPHSGVDPEQVNAPPQPTPATLPGSLQGTYNSAWANVVFAVDTSTAILAKKLAESEQGTYGHTGPVTGNTGTGVRAYSRDGDVYFRVFESGSRDPVFLGVAPQVAPVGAQAAIPTGRLLEDSILELPGPLVLDGVRPTLEFRHWLDGGDGGLAVIEVARTPPLVPQQGVAESLSVQPPEEANPDPRWKRVVAFNGTSPTTLTAPARIPLDGFAGEEVFIRFRFHNGASTDFSRVGAGWLIEDVKVRMADSTGPKFVHEAQNNFTGYPPIVGGTIVDAVVGPPARWPAPTEAQPVPRLPNFTNDQCPRTPPQRRNKHDLASSFVTDPVDLTTMAYPALTLRHNGTFKWDSIGATLGQTTMVDLEYQFQNTDGTWPATWYPGVPKEPARLMAVATDPVTHVSALTDLKGQPIGYPFSGTPTGTRAAWDNAVKSSTLEETEQQFDLQFLRGINPLGSSHHVVRFRLTAWVQRPTAENPAALQDCRSFVNWSLHAIRVGESRHLADAGINGLSLRTDDSNIVRQLAPALLQDFAGRAILSNDRARLLVNLTNFGRVDLRANVSVQVVSATPGQAPPVVSFIDTARGVLRREERTGVVDLNRTAEFTYAEFLLDAQKTAPGEYIVNVLVEPNDAVDTNPINDADSLRIVVQPLRALQVVEAQSRVTPRAASSDASRSVTVRVQNQGNIDENVTVRARVVEVTGLNEFHPDALAVLEPRRLTLNARSAPQSTTWTLEPSPLVLSRPFETGKQYAVAVSVRPDPDSAKSWWIPQKPPMNETTQGGPLLNLTRDGSECGCVLLPFLVEKRLYGTDFSAQNSTSLVDEMFPADRPWTGETFVEGRPLAPSDEGIPTWQSLAADEAASAVPGHATGRVHYLPAYEGLEEVEHILTSPELPTHTIQGASQAIMALRFATNVADGKAFIETRTRDGDSWSAWTPAGSLRAQRVAVVVAPDFPIVNATKFPGLADYRPGHPAPPFYDSNGQPTGCTQPGQTPGSWESLCSWTPFPQPARDALAAQALNLTLRTLAARVGEDNVGVFTTLGPAFGLDLASPAGSSVQYLEVQGFPQPDGSTPTHAFPVLNLSYLGKRLDSYGAILLVGDGFTSTFAAESATLQFLSHGPNDAVNRPPNPLVLAHDRELFSILKQAPNAGVAILGSIGPATVGLAMSGVAQNAAVTTWQPMMMPEALPAFGASDTLQAKCTADNNNGQVINTSHTKPSCKKGQPAGPPITNTDNPNNYLYYPTDWAQGLALRDLLSSYGADFSYTLTVGCVGGICRNPRAVVTSQMEGRPTFLITAAASGNAGPWINQVLQVLGTVYTGQIPGGDGAWTSLPPELSYPVGGHFRRGADGTDRFAGSEMQVRVRILSDPMLGGHGSFAVDRFELLGTNRTTDLALNILTPRDGRNYAPGSPFHVRLEAINQGTARTPISVARLRVDQTGNCGGSCVAIGTYPFVQEITIPSLAGGQRTVLTLDEPGRMFSNGFFPSRTQPQTPPASAFDFDLRLQPAPPGDAEPSDDESAVRAFGLEVVDVRFQEIRVEPNEEADAILDAVNITAVLLNQGVQTQRASVTLDVEHARNRACRPSHNLRRIVACHPDPARDEPLEPVLAGERQLVTVPMDGTAAATWRLDLEERGLVPGVYRFVLGIETTFSDGTRLARVEQERWFHLADSAVLPDGGLAADFDRLDTAVPGFGSPPGYYAVGGSGFLMFNGVGTNMGAYGPDQSTVSDEQDTLGLVLQHGWRSDMVTGYRDGGNTTGPVASFEWRRDPQIATSPVGEHWPANQGNAEGAGDGDFGPDHLVWQPYNIDTPDSPFLTLASFENPRLTFQTQFQASPNTAFVVEMQLARRLPCAVAQDGTMASLCPEFPVGPGATPARGWNWTWGAGPSEGTTDWLPLVNGFTGPGPLNTNHVMRSHQVQNEMYRDAPSNQMATRLGIWGSSSSPSHAENDGWVRIEYSIDPEDPYIQAYCRRAHGIDFVSELPVSDACRYAPTLGSLYQDPGPGEIPRPVRFRFRAASFGGDSGASFWRIDDLAVTEHSVQYDGPLTRSILINDGESQAIPIRIRNAGSVVDVVDVSLPYVQPELWGSNAAVRKQIGFSSRGPFVDETRLTLKPGEARLLWVRFQVTHEHGLPAGFPFAVPFLVRTVSIRDPTAGGTLLVDAVFNTIPRADLELRPLIVGRDADPLRVLNASVQVPLPVTIRIRNSGAVPLGGPLPDVPLRLIEKITLNNGTVVGPRPAVNASLQPSRTMLGTLLPCSRQSCESVQTLEWLPRIEGAYELSAEVNPVDELGQRLAESDYENNVERRNVHVGPVDLPDLQVVDAWLVPFENGCGQERVVHAIAGHLYCAAALVENKGRRPALPASVAFRIGDSDAFSIPADSTEFPGSPGQRTYFSSPWKAVLRSDAGRTWQFHADVFTASPAASVHGKTRDWTVTVDAYLLQTMDALRNVTLPPGQTVFITLNVTNRGTASATPIARVSQEDGPLRVHVVQPPPLLVGETVPVRIAVTTSPRLVQGASVPKLVLGTMEDSLFQLELPLRLQAGAAGAPQALAFPLESRPGNATLELVLDNRVNAPAVWRLTNSSSPLQLLDAPAPLRLNPNDRLVRSFPIVIAANTPPGTYTGAVEMLVQRSGFEQLLEVPVTVRVDRLPQAEARLESSRATALMGQSVTLLAQVTNTGNVPLEVRLEASTQPGQSTVPPPQIVTPGETRTLAFDVQGGASNRTLGSLRVAWREADTNESAEHITAPTPWQVDYMPGVVRIESSDLDAVALRPGVESTVTAVVVNPGDRPFDAEVLLVVDGQLHGRVVLSLGPEQRSTVKLPLRAGPSGVEQEYALIARPAGSRLQIDDPAFALVADANVRLAEPAEGDASNGTPAVGIGFFLVVIAAAALALRRNRRRRW